MNLAQNILVFGLRGYRTLVSPLLTAVFGPMGCGCRFTPTCSCYAIEAVKTHGALRGSWLAACRVGRCHPWGGQGEDPVPPRKLESLESRVANRPSACEAGQDDSDGHSCSLSLACGPGKAGVTPRLISHLHGS